MIPPAGSEPQRGITGHIFVTVVAAGAPANFLKHFPPIGGVNVAVEGGLGDLIAGVF